MKRKALVFIALLLPASLFAQTAIGHWRDCLDYSRVQHVAVTPDGIYAAGRGGLFFYDTDDQTLTTLSRSSGLSDVGIAAMAYNNGSLVVGYTSSNIDILQGRNIYNLSDIKRSSISGDRNIYHIRFHNGLAYLCTGFGVVVIDLNRHEIKETYYIGTAGNYTAVYDIAFMPDSIYAATAEGLKRISASEQHLGISDRWLTDHRMDGVTVTMLCAPGSKLLAAGYTADPNQLKLYNLSAGSVSTMLSGELRSMRVEGNRLTVCLDGMVAIYDTALNYLRSLNTYTWGHLSAIDAAISGDGTLWVAHPWDGLVAIYPDGSDATFKPAGPYNSDNVYKLVPVGDKMLLCPGGRTITYSASYTPANLLTTDGRSWSTLDNSNHTLDGLYDIVDVAAQDKTTLLAASWGNGIISIKDNQAQTIYDQTNTDGALQAFSSGTWNSLMVGALTADRSGNVWALNVRSPRPLVVRHKDGSWESFSTESMTGTQPEMDKIIYDSVRNYIWFCGRSNNIYVHDGQSRMARINPNNGSKMETETVNTIVQDRDGNIWIGTNKGIKVIYDGYRAFDNGGNGETSPVTCNNITITNGSFAEYLMAYENVTCIAVDGANRKWVGTATGGLYLLSAGGLEQLQNFTTANSPLFSDKIVCIAIHPSTGDVYIGTDHGLQVYRSTATYAEPYTAEQVYAYPNPVRPGYDGPIAIKGFARDALIHITDASGHTLFSTQALGGQAIWNGRTQSGEPVASGVYYVFASDIDGGNRAVAKILIIR